MTPAPGLIEAALRSIFPGEVAVAAERIVPGNISTLWAEERPTVAGAVPARLDEFVTGRTVARRVLHALGLPPQALPMGPDRAAIWPSGVAGSIAHAAGYAVAVGRHGPPVGIDLEEDAALAPDLWPIIGSPDELRRLAPDDTGRQVRRLFCANRRNSSGEQIIGQRSDGMAASSSRSIPTGGP